MYVGLRFNPPTISEVFAIIFGATISHKIKLLSYLKQDKIMGF